MPTHTFPFSAIVGQEPLKTALLMTVVDPAIGGVLVRGHRGTAKTTAIRALAPLLPEQDVVLGCRFGCDPGAPDEGCADCRRRRAAGEEPLPSRRVRRRIVELPLGATEDSVVGSLDIDAALTHGTRQFRPGLLAQAHRNILYVDEINLLDDQLVNVLLDAAATGVNVVARDGVSHWHPSRFTLIGSMNPGEGELRPQLLDRFGLCVDVETILDRNQRVQIAERDTSFRNGSAQFLSRFLDADGALAGRVMSCAQALGNVVLDERDQRLISGICADAGSEGHRADRVIGRTVKALVSYRGRSVPTRQDIHDAAHLALAHRARRAVGRTMPGPEGGDGQDQDDCPQDTGTRQPPSTAQLSSGSGGPGTKPTSSEADTSGQQTEEDNGAASRSSDRSSASAPGAESTVEAVPAIAATSLYRGDLNTRREPRPTRFTGKTRKVVSRDRRGRYVGARPAERITDLAIDATLREAAVHQLHRGRHDGAPLVLRSGDLRQKVRRRKVGNLIVFVIDASASMDAEARMSATKGAVLALLRGAYIRRDRVAVVAFRGSKAEVLLGPTAGALKAQSALERLAVGGTTPLAHGLVMAHELIRLESLKDRDLRPLLVLVSDGRGNVPLGREDPAVAARLAAERIRASRVDSVVLDTVPRRRNVPVHQLRHDELQSGAACARLAEQLGGRHVLLQEFTTEQIASAVDAELGVGRTVRGLEPIGGTTSWR